MEIQFTIKLFGSSGSAAVLKKDSNERPEQGHTLGSHAPPPGENPVPESSEQAEKPPESGGGGDDAGPGGTGAGMGQVIVIGPIVITGAAASTGTKGGGGDDAGPGGGRPQK